MRKSIDDAVDDHPPDDDERPPVSWAVAVSDDCDACGPGDLRVVLVGVPTPEMTLELPLLDVFGRGGSLKSSWYGDCLPSRDFPMLVDLHVQGRLPLEKFVSETIALDQARDRFANAKQRDGANDAAQHRADDVDDKYRGEKQHDIGEQWRDGEAIRGQEECEGLAQEDGYPQRNRNTEQVDYTKNRAIANAIKDEQHDSDEKKQVNPVKRPDHREFPPVTS